MIEKGALRDIEDDWFHPDASLTQLPIEKGAVVYFHYSMTCVFHTRCTYVRMLLSHAVHMLLYSCAVSSQASCNAVVV